MSLIRKMFLFSQAKYKERGNVLAEDQIAQVILQICCIFKRKISCRPAKDWLWLVAWKVNKVILSG